MSEFSGADPPFGRSLFKRLVSPSATRRALSMRPRSRDHSDRSCRGHGDPGIPTVPVVGAAARSLISATDLMKTVD
jgi:hypothetical protein